MVFSYITTSLMPSGNRLVTEAFCPGPPTPRILEQVDITTTLDVFGADVGVQWIVGAPSLESDGAFWVQLEDGRQISMASSWTEDDLTILVGNGTTTTTTDSPERPLLLTPSENDTYEPLEQPVMTSPLSSAVPTPNGGYLMVTADNGYKLTQLAPDGTDVSSESLRAIVDPLPDSMIAQTVKNDTQTTRWALYTGITSRYDHAVIGDDLEGGALTVLQWMPDTELVEFHSSATLNNEDQADTVFEGLGPIWADVNDDGIDDLITTISNSAVGARLRVYSLNDDGNTDLVQLAQAEAINLGGRWLHQLAAGPLGPNGETEIVEIRTPHIGGIVRYYRLDPEATSADDNLKLVASTQRYTSHDIGSRNLDRAVVGDFNGDGVPELIVQNQVKDTLVGLQRTNEVAGIETAWYLPMSSPVESNIAVNCNAELGTMEVMLSTRGHDLVKATFRPADVEIDGIPHDDDGQEYQPLEQTSGSAPVIITSGASTCWVGPSHTLGHTQQVFLCVVGFAVLCLGGLANSF